MTFFEHRSGVYTEVHEQRGAEKRHLQQGIVEMMNRLLEHDVIILTLPSSAASMRGVCKEIPCPN